MPAPRLALAVLVAVAVAAPVAADPAPAPAPAPAPERIRSLATDRGRVFAIVQLAAGRTVIRALDGKLHPTAQLAAPAGVTLYTLAVSPDHRDLAVARSDGAIWILDPATLHERRTVHVTGKIVELPGATGVSEDLFGEVRGLGYTPTGKLVSISEYGALCFADKAICYDAMPSSTGVIPAGQLASFGVAGERAVFAWRASKLVVLQPGTAPVALGRDFKLPDNLAEVLAAAPTGWVALSYMTNTVDLLKADVQLQLPAPRVAALAFSPSGRYLAIATRDEVERYDLRCIDQAPPPMQTVSPAGAPAATAVIVTDRGVVITGDAAGHVTTTAADDAPTPKC